MLERRPTHVFERGEMELVGAPGRGREDRRRVVEEPDDVRVGARRLPEHAKDLRLALEPRQRLRRHRVGTQHLDDDEVAFRLVPRGREDPPLATLADALPEMEPCAARPLQHLPREQVAQGEQARVTGVHGHRHASAT